jgi:hypothetical protein
MKQVLIIEPFIKKVSCPLSTSSPRPAGIAQLMPHLILSCVNGQTDGQMDRRTGRRMDRQTDGRAGGWTDRQTGGRAEGQTDRWTDRHMGRQMDRQTDEWTDRRKDR